jgi:hypothetical protein
MRRAADLVVGVAEPERDPWERLDEAFRMLNCYDLSEECRRWTDACQEAMVRAGLDPQWVKADYDNIDELLLGELGPAPD